jgi:branched-chain amino acid transport system ATP-binding protein
MSAETSGAEPILSIEHVAVRFGGVTAISDMTFDVALGELVSLIGPNGAGKTTAFNVVTGFLRPSQGVVKFKGLPLAGLRPHEVAARGLVRTFQRTNLFDKCSVYDNVLIGLHRRANARLLGSLLRLPRERRLERELREKVWEILELAGLADQGGELGASLPYGKQRLLGVALALAADPEALLLDEPVSGMNASETQRFVELIRKLRRRGLTILLVEHDMPMVMGISDRIVVLNYGRIIANGRPEAIQRNPEVIRAYLGQGVRHA